VSSPPLRRLLHLTQVNLTLSKNCHNLTGISTLATDATLDSFAEPSPSLERGKIKPLSSPDFGFRVDMAHGDDLKTCDQPPEIASSAYKPPVTAAPAPSVFGFGQGQDPAPTRIVRVRQPPGGKSSIVFG
jgi:hypothetical protein